MDSQNSEPQFSIFTWRVGLEKRACVCGGRGGQLSLTRITRKTLHQSLLPIVIKPQIEAPTSICLVQFRERLKFSKQKLQFYFICYHCNRSNRVLDSEIIIIKAIIILIVLMIFRNILPSGRVFKNIDSRISSLQSLKEGIKTPKSPKIKYCDWFEKRLDNVDVAIVTPLSVEKTLLTLS